MYESVETGFKSFCCLSLNTGNWNLPGCTYVLDACHVLEALPHRIIKYEDIYCLVFLHGGLCFLCQHCSSPSRPGLTVHLCTGHIRMAGYVFSIRGLRQMVAGGRLNLYSILYPQGAAICEGFYSLIKRK